MPPFPSSTRGSTLSPLALCSDAGASLQTPLPSHLPGPSNPLSAVPALVDPLVFIGLTSTPPVPGRTP